LIEKKAKFAVVMYRPYAVRKTLDIFRDKWSFEVLQELFHGVRRFDQFQENLKISRSVLTRRLKHLAAKSIISREVYQERPRRFEYRLTARGVDMYAIFLMLRQWGERWLEAGKNESVGGIRPAATIRGEYAGGFTAGFTSGDIRANEEGKNHPAISASGLQIRY